MPARSGRNAHGHVRVKRVYDPPERDDGLRVLVDRLWPRGLAKEKAGVDLWLKEIAPSDALRRWFGHDPKRWSGFQAKYRAEIAGEAEALAALEAARAQGDVTLLYAARDPDHNNAVVLKAVLEEAAAR